MSKRRVCLDACLFIALQRHQEHSSEIIGSIKTLLAQIERGDDYAIVSTIIETELLDGSLEILEPLCDTRKGEFVDVDRPIAALARKIRNKIVRKAAKEATKVLDLPDCVYLATAIIYDCDCFVTIDGLGNNKHSPLSAADQIKREFKLRVCSPVDAVDQQVLDLKVDVEPKK